MTQKTADDLIADIYPKYTTQNNALVDFINENAEIHAALNTISNLPKGRPNHTKQKAYSIIKRFFLANCHEQETDNKTINEIITTLSESEAEPEQINEAFATIYGPTAQFNATNPITAFNRSNDKGQFILQAVNCATGKEKYPPLHFVKYRQSPANQINFSNVDNLQGLSDSIETTLNSIDDNHHKKTFKFFCAKILAQYSDAAGGLDKALGLLASFNAKTAIIAMKSFYSDIDSPTNNSQTKQLQEIQTESSDGKKVTLQVLENISKGKITEPYTAKEWRDVAYNIASDSGNVDPTIDLFKGCNAK